MVHRSLVLLVTAPLMLVLSASSVSADSPRWHYRTPMPTARNVVVAVAVDHRVMAIGGQVLIDPSTGQATDAVEVYDPRTDDWATAAPLLDAVMQAGATAGRHGRVYVVGGVDATDHVTNVLQAWDPIS